MWVCVSAVYFDGESVSRLVDIAATHREAAASDRSRNRSLVGVDGSIESYNW